VLLLKWTTVSVALHGDGGRWLAKLIQSQKMIIDATKRASEVAATTGGPSDLNIKFLRLGTCPTSKAAEQPSTATAGSREKRTLLQSSSPIGVRL
jgi:hypothetical protein